MLNLFDYFCQNLLILCKMSGFPQHLLYGGLEDKRVGRYAGIGERSSHGICHCEGVKRPWQSQSSGISSVIFCSVTLPIRTYRPSVLSSYRQKQFQPHPSPLLVKEREQENVLSPRERVRERADLRRPEDKRVGGYAVISERSSQNETCHCQRMKRPCQSHNLTLPFTSPPLKGGDMESLPLIGKVRMGFKQSPLTLTLSLKGRGNNISVLSRAKVNSLGRGDNIKFLKRTYSLIDLLTYSLKVITLPFTSPPLKGGDMERVQLIPAFTLAEVLITLGIIGVVAAMTLPTLVAKYQSKVYATRIKHAHSLLQNSLNLYKVKNDCDNYLCLFYTSYSFFTGSR